MSDWFTVETRSTGWQDHEGLERIHEAYGLLEDWLGILHGRFMRDAEEDFAIAGFVRQTRICNGDAVRYTFSRPQARQHLST